MVKWIYIAFVLIGFNALSQKLSASVDDNNILIGEPIIITYKVLLKPNANVEFEPDQEYIRAKATEGGVLTNKDVEFEILEAFTDTVKLKDNEKEWIGRYTVTVWDSGTFILPAPSIIINNSTHRFDKINVYATYAQQIKGFDIYDINESYAEIPDETFSFLEFLAANWWWLLIIISIIPVYLLIKRKKKEEEPKKLFKAMSLKERTLMAIDALDNEKMWEKDKLKEHFVELSYILRSYLTARYNLSLLEKTTYETKLLLTKKGLNEDTVENVGRILSESDMVKFAKSKPEVISILRVSTLARQIVAETSPLEFDNVE